MTFAESLWIAAYNEELARRYAELLTISDFTGIDDSRFAEACAAARDYANAAISNLTGGVAALQAAINALNP